MNDDNILGTVTVSVGGRSFAVPVGEQLKINVMDLNEELAEQPGRYAYWAALLVALEQECAEISLMLEELRARKYKDLRMQMVNEGKKPTEAQLEYELTLDSEIMKMERKLIEKQRERNLVKAIKDAFEQRKDALISIASNLRVERDSELKVSFRKNSI